MVRSETCTSWHHNFFRSFMRDLRKFPFCPFLACSAHSPKGLYIFACVNFFHSFFNDGSESSYLRIYRTGFLQSFYRTKMLWVQMIWTSLSYISKDVAMVANLVAKSQTSLFCPSGILKRNGLSLGPYTSVCA